VVEYDYSGVAELNEAMDALHARVRDDYKAGIIQLNEARELLGFDAVEGGDVVASTLTPPPATTSPHPTATGRSCGPTERQSVGGGA
jgi:hypothetical protein